jgi:hypothetical protein
LTLGRPLTDATKLSGSGKVELVFIRRGLVSEEVLRQLGKAETINPTEHDQGLFMTLDEKEKRNFGEIKEFPKRRLSYVDGSLGYIIKSFEARIRDAG